MELLTEKTLSNCITQRLPESHKGTYGRVVLIGGNAQYGGAIIMATTACVRSGAGLVTAVSHPSNQTALHAHCPESMFVDWNNIETIKQVCSNATVIIIGPGLGDNSRSIELLETTLLQILPSQYLIIDGSAITLIGNEKVTFPKTIAQRVIFTPHQKEWERLSHIKIIEQSEKNNRLSQVRLGNPVVVLKQHRTEIYTAHNVFKNPIGTPAMATGGMGDTLAGMIGGFCAQFSPVEDTLNAAVYLHSYIGEELSKENYVVLPTDIISKIPYFMKKFEQ